MKIFLLTAVFTFIGSWVFAQAHIPEGLLYEVVDGKTVTITGYRGSDVTLNIPEYIQGLPVTVVDRLAFEYRSGFFATDGGDFKIAGDSLTSITIPSSVSSMGNGALANCSNLTSISVDNRNSVYASRDGVLFDKNIRTIIAYPAGKESPYAIPSSVMAIGDWAFSGCYKLPGISIPSSVTSIGEGAFFNCISLTNITIPSSVTFIGTGAFRFCISLTSITIPSSVTSISDGTFFACRNLTNVTIPSSVTSIGNFAFYDCSSLTSVSITRRTKVGENAFPSRARITYRD